MAIAGDFDYERGGQRYATAAHRSTDRRRGARGAGVGPHRAQRRCRAPARTSRPTGTWSRSSLRRRCGRSARRTPFPAVDGVAEDLPFADDSFDACHGHGDRAPVARRARGLREMRRVSRGPVVVLTFDGDALDRLLAGRLRTRAHRRRTSALSGHPSTSASAPRPGGRRVTSPRCRRRTTASTGSPRPITPDPSASSRRPVAAARSRRGDSWRTESKSASSSTCARDLESGAWDERYGHLRSQELFEGSLRLVVQSA